MDFPDDGVLGYSEAAADFARAYPFGPEFAQAGYGAFGPGGIVDAVHDGLLSSVICPGGLFDGRVSRHGAKGAGGPPAGARSATTPCALTAARGSESYGVTTTISPNGMVRLSFGVSQITGRPGSFGLSLESRSVA